MTNEAAGEFEFGWVSTVDLETECCPVDLAFSPSILTVSTKRNGQTYELRQSSKQREVGDGARDRRVFQISKGLDPLERAYAIGIDRVIFTFSGFTA